MASPISNPHGVDLEKDCLQCSDTFYKPDDLSWPNWEKKQFCSRYCASAARRTRSVVGRPIEQVNPAVLACDAHLRALIRYGFNHDNDLGMGAEAFFARARSLEMAA